MSDNVRRARELLAAATPGPWHTGPHYCAPYITAPYVAAPYGNAVALVIVPTPANASDHRLMVPQAEGTVEGERQSANAALIAAAPELLAALCGDVDRLTRERDEAHTCQLLRSAQVDAGRALLGRLAAAESERDGLRAEVRRTAAIRESWDAAQIAQRERIAEIEALRAESTRHTLATVAICGVLEANGCDCDCGCDADGHFEDCDPCVACRVQEALRVSP